MNHTHVARLLESTFQPILAAALRIPVYRSDESSARMLPCIVLVARAQGEDLAVRVPGHPPATTVELRASALVSLGQPDPAAAVHELAASLRASIENAVISSGWLYLRLDYEGDDRAADDVKRAHSHIYTVTALPE